MEAICADDKTAVCPSVPIQKTCFGLILTGMSGCTGLHNIQSPGNIWFPSKCPPPQNFQLAQNIWLPARYTFSQQLWLKLQKTAVSQSVLVQKIFFWLISAAGSGRVHILNLKICPAKYLQIYHQYSSSCCINPQKENSPDVHFRSQLNAPPEFPISSKYLAAGWTYIFLWLKLQNPYPRSVLCTGETVRSSMPHGTLL